MKKLSVVVYGSICYGAFLFTFLYAIGFTGNFLVPKSIDGGIATPGIQAYFINFVLLSVFALQHSIMARPAFKKWWVRIIPAEIERSTYVLLASLALLLIFWKWNPMNEVVWKVDQTAIKLILTVLFFTGWLIVLLATFMINHFDLFGLRQVLYYLENKPAGDPVFKTKWLYKIVRHPVMLGFLIAFWATPVMTVGHFIFTATCTAYILVAVKFLEEKDLEIRLGNNYREYQKNVPMLIPFTKNTQREEASDYDFLYLD